MPNTQRRRIILTLFSKRYEYTKGTVTCLRQSTIFGSSLANGSAEYEHQRVPGLPISGWSVSLHLSNKLSFHSGTLLCKPFPALVSNLC